MLVVNVHVPQKVDLGEEAAPRPPGAEGDEAEALQQTGEHTEEVLLALGYTPAEIATFRASKVI